MGCDIHIVLERKYGLKWIAVDTFKGHESGYTKTEYASPIVARRNYERFTALANVRGEGGLDPRGAPSDISETTAMLLEDWEGDAHSMSWLSLEDATKIFAATEQSKKTDFAEKYPQSHFFGIDEGDKAKHRVVFWFDN